MPKHLKAADAQGATFVDELPPPARPARGFWPAVAELAKSQPGRWLRIREGTTSAFPGWTGRNPAIRDVHFEGRSRRNVSTGLIDWYLRWVADVD